MQNVWEVCPILWAPSSGLPDTSGMASKLDLVLKAFVAANRPLVRLLIGRGATFPAVAERLRQLFVDEAVAEIRARGMKPTASAVSLLSGVHRKDLRARELAGVSDPHRRLEGVGAALERVDEHGIHEARDVARAGQQTGVSPLENLHRPAMEVILAVPLAAVHRHRESAPTRSHTTETARCRLVGPVDSLEVVVPLQPTTEEHRHETSPGESA